MMKGNDSMKIGFNNKEFEFELHDGEYRRYVEEDGSRSAEYLCVGIDNTNRILFQYIDTTGDIIDYVQSIVDNIPEFALNYLVNVLSQNDNILIRLTCGSGVSAGFEIYYNCDCKGNSIDDMIEWMWTNNDFEAAEFRYTEIIDGHQKCVGE